MEGFGAQTLETGVVTGDRRGANLTLNTCAALSLYRVLC